MVIQTPPSQLVWDCGVVLSLLGARGFCASLLWSLQLLLNTRTFQREAASAGVSMQGGSGGFGTWHLQTRRFEEKNRTGMTLCFSPAPGFHLAPGYSTMRDSWHRGYHLLPWFFPLPPMDAEEFKTLKGSGQLCTKKDAHLGSFPLTRAKAGK